MKTLREAGSQQNKISPVNRASSPHMNRPLNAYFEPQKHRLQDVYRFRQAKQGDVETLDQYYTQAQTLSKRCDFADADFEIMLQIVLFAWHINSLTKISNA